MSNCNYPSGPSLVVYCTTYIVLKPPKLADLPPELPSHGRAVQRKKCVGEPAGNP